MCKANQFADRLDHVPQCSSNAQGCKMAKDTPRNTSHQKPKFTTQSVKDRYYNGYHVSLPPYSDPLAQLNIPDNP